MKKKELEDLRSKLIKELEKQAQDLIKEIALQKLEFEANKPKDSNILLKKRKKLARIWTIIEEKKVAL